MKYKCEMLNGKTRQVNLKKMHLVAVNYQGGYTSGGINPDDLHSIVQHRTDIYIDNSGETLRFFAASGVCRSNDIEYHTVSEITRDNAIWSIGESAIVYKIDDNEYILYMPNEDMFDKHCVFDEDSDLNDPENKHEYVFSHVLASIA